MKTRDVKELNQKTKMELLKLLKDKREELVKFKIDMSLSKVKNLNLGKMTKKDIARIITILSQKKEEKNVS